MAFFDTVSNKAKGIAGNAKIGVKISNAEHEISELKFELGDVIWKGYNGENPNPEAEINRLCEKIKSAYNRIDALNHERDEITGKAKYQPEAAAAASVCSSCGAILPENSNFCPNCGEKIPEFTDPVADADSNICKGCGFELSDNQYFCPRCGVKR